MSEHDLKQNGFFKPPLSFAEAAAADAIAQHPQNRCAPNGAKPRTHPTTHGPPKRWRPNASHARRQSKSNEQGLTHLSLGGGRGLLPSQRLRCEQTRKERGRKLM